MNQQDHTARWSAEDVRRAEQAYERSHGGRRKKKKNGPLRFLVWLLCVLAASAILAEAGWLLANDFCSFNKPELEVTLEVTKDDDLSTIATKLKDAGLIDYKWFFRFFGKLNHASSKIGIGSYTLTSDMDYGALINHMRNTNASLNAKTVKVSIPEGYNVNQTIRLLAKYGVNTEEELLEAARFNDFGYQFLNPALIGEERRLEGYLFPDTYEFFVGENAAHALNRLLENFDHKLDAELLEKVEESPYSLQEIITIASLIEKETDGTDRSTISSVIHNRLTHAAETAYYLQIDASLIYGLGDSFSGMLMTEDKDYESAYNLYLHPGLPPTPIANPGIESIKAAVEPKSTDYYFYALGRDKVHHFFTTYRDHVNFINSSQYGG